jgi:hypothetical protein
MGWAWHLIQIQCSSADTFWQFKLQCLPEVLSKRAFDDDVCRRLFSGTTHLTACFLDHTFLQEISFSLYTALDQ